MIFFLPLGLDSYKGNFLCSLPSLYIAAVLSLTLRKYAFSNILKILPPKREHFQIKNSDILHISVQNIDCGTR